MDGALIDDWQRPGPNRRQRRLDVWVGLAVTAVGVLNLVLGTSLGIFGPVRGSWLALMPWLVAVTLPLVVRRRWPEASALVVAAAFIAGQVRGVPEGQVTTGALFTVIFTLGAWGRRHRLSRGLRWLIIAAMSVWWLVALWRNLPDLTPAQFPHAAGPLPPIPAAVLNNFVGNVALFGFAYLLGEVAWRGARREHLLGAESERHRARVEAAERAVYVERVRIARELHDVVAHHVSVMGVQAGAARRVMDRDTAKARAALTAIEQSARTAVEELRRMLGLLRRSDGDATGDPTGDPAEKPAAVPASAGIDRVDELVAGVGAAGLTAHCAVYGEPVPLPDSVSQTAYRIVQESVTNVLKHAAARTVDVRVRYLAGAVEVDVADDGRGGTPAEGGMGLIGMRERVAVLDGTLEVGPRSGAGFRVRARLPFAREGIGA